jgi:hypothetical protein
MLCPLERCQCNEALVFVRAALGERRFEPLSEEARPMTLEQTVALALE